jgi:peptidoglycan hydrolase-like protein with peptidoglycan-binding domain
MTIAKTNVVAKAAAVVAGLGLVFASVAPAASAQSTADLQAQIAALLAQIQSLQAQLGTSSSAAVMFNADLTIGSTGSDVTALQNWLIAKGYSIPAGATGYFGAQTQAAVAAYQAANGITPAAGYFGPITRAKVNASAGTSTGTGTGTGSTGTGSLSGGEGSIDNFKLVGASNTSLDQGDNDTVYGFEFKATGSDLSVNRVDYDVYKQSGNGSIRPWNVFQTAELWNGNTKVASVDVSSQSDWSQDGTDNSTGNQIYRVRFDSLNNVVKQNSTVDYYLKLYTQNAISSSNAGATYGVTLAPQGLRATDAMGIQQYTTSNTTWNTVSVDNNTTGGLTISTGSDNPQTTTVMGDENNTTTGIVVNTFSLQAKNSDLDIYELPVTIATSSSKASNIIRSVKLYQGSTLLDTESVSSSAADPAVVNFSNLNVHLSEGSTQNFSIQVDVNKIDGTNFAEGAGITVTVPQSGNWDVENSSGDTINPTGSSAGNLITFRSIGFSVDSSPSVASAVATNNGGNVTTQTGTFTFTFNVTAFGQDIYIAKDASKAFDATVYNNGSAVSTTTANAISSTADRDGGTQNFVVHNGQTKQVTITVSKNAGNGLFYYVVLNHLYYATSTGALSATTTEQQLTFPSSYQTNQVIINS